MITTRYATNIILRFDGFRSHVVTNDPEPMLSWQVLCLGIKKPCWVHSFLLCFYRYSMAGFLRGAEKHKNSVYVLYTSHVVGINRLMRRITHASLVMAIGRCDVTSRFILYPGLVLYGHIDCTPGLPTSYLLLSVFILQRFDAFSCLLYCGSTLHARGINEFLEAPRGLRQGELVCKSIIYVSRIEVR
jgi:hypothetical protein